jgi:hypothetical protein
MVQIPGRGVDVDLDPFDLAVEGVVSRTVIFRCGGLTRTAESAGRAKSSIVEEHDQNVWRTDGWPKGRIGGNFVSGSSASQVVNPVRLMSGIGITSRREESWEFIYCACRFDSVGRKDDFKTFLEQERTSDASGAARTLSKPFLRCPRSLLGRRPLHPRARMSAAKITCNTHRFVSL